MFAKNWLLRGLSPLARGNQRALLGSMAPPGTIPARAGQPTPRPRACPADWDYPRSRGATNIFFNEDMYNAGLSPLARGNLLAAAGALPTSGTIPARAGQPSCLPTTAMPDRDYPRSRGATMYTPITFSDGAGLSQLARGNLSAGIGKCSYVGTIPARAGQPRPTRTRSATSMDYPRSRGATTRCATPRMRRRGLSPLARGNRADTGHADSSRRTIPARAGQPATAGTPACECRDYPRSRGATRRLARGRRRRSGLSPLARGNHRHWTLDIGRVGTIPARAGQPNGIDNHDRSRGDYPRSRGATFWASSTHSSIAGLSPLARGNPHRGRWLHRRDGTIPARAGQPTSRILYMTTLRDYPRSRGATEITSRPKNADPGLSPLARGNPAVHVAKRLLVGTIPARAGQPNSVSALIGFPWDYPRSRGATTCPRESRGPTRGLSPLARGNPSPCRIDVLVAGTIPARAGQPVDASVTLGTGGDYPRSRGATVFAGHVQPGEWGLSPLARGNLLHVTLCRKREKRQIHPKF